MKLGPVNTSWPAPSTASHAQGHLAAGQGPDSILTLELFSRLTRLGLDLFPPVKTIVTHDVAQLGSPVTRLLAWDAVP